MSSNFERLHEIINQAYPESFIILSWKTPKWVNCRHPYLRKLFPLFTLRLTDAALILTTLWYFTCLHKTLKRSYLLEWTTRVCVLLAHRSPKVMYSTKSIAKIFYYTGWILSQMLNSINKAWKKNILFDWFDESILICQNHQLIFSLLAMKNEMTIAYLSTSGKTVHFYTKEQLFSIIIGMTIGSFFHSGENVVINLIERFPLHRTAVISIFRPSFIWDFSAMTWPLWLTPRECRKLDISFTFVKRQPVYYSESKSFWHCLHYKFFDEFINKNKKRSSKRTEKCCQLNTLSNFAVLCLGIMNMYRLQSKLFGNQHCFSVLRLFTMYIKKECEKWVYISGPNCTSLAIVEQAVAQ